jgi:hypothetical protein
VPRIERRQNEPFPTIEAKIFPIFWIVDCVGVQRKGQYDLNEEVELWNVSRLLVSKIAG